MIECIQGVTNLAVHSPLRFPLGGFCCAVQGKIFRLFKREGEHPPRGGLANSVWVVPLPPSVDLPRAIMLGPKAQQKQARCTTRAREVMHRTDTCNAYEGSLTSCGIEQQYRDLHLTVGTKLPGTLGDLEEEESGSSCHGSCTSAILTSSHSSIANPSREGRGSESARLQ